MTARTAPAATRNRLPILHVLRRVLPPAGLVLEVASGTGEHALWFSQALPSLDWQPTDSDAEALTSIAAWRREGSANLRPPLALDAARPERWPIRRAAAVVAINMVHIAPWPACEGLLAGAGAILPQGGVLFLYGPFRDGDAALAPGNAAFDLDLRARDPAWGLRDLQAIADLATRHGLAMMERVTMPADNLSLIFRREAVA